MPHSDAPDVDVHGFLDLLKLLIRTPSVIGAERPFFRVLERELVERGARVTAYEGLLVAEGNSPDSCHLSAHVDRHGLIATGPGHFEYAAFIAQNRGEQSGDSISEQTFHKVAERFVGERVHAYEPWSGSYLGQATISGYEGDPERVDLFFRVDDLDWLPPGAPIAYLDKLNVLDDRIEAQLDNVLTVAALVHLFELGYQGTAFFTAQEEVGRSWRVLVEWFVRHSRSTNRLLVVDTSPYPDFDQVLEQDLVLRNRDATAPFDAEAVAETVRLCEQLGYRATFKDEWIEADNEKRAARGESARSLGRTELGRVIEGSGGRISGTTLQVPTCGYHTPHETAALTSVEALLQVLMAWSSGSVR